MGFETSRLIEKAAVSIAASLLASVMLLPPASDAQTSPPASSAQTVLASSHDRWLHVRVTNPGRNEESVRVNVPLELAEKVLPTINKDRLHSGRVRFDDIDCHGVDLRALLDAVRTSKDGEFVTVQNKDSDVRVAKRNGTLFVHVSVKDEENTVRVWLDSKNVED
jgi:hypothetical protein